MSRLLGAELRSGPNIAKVERVTRGDVRCVKLYYLRGKAAKIKEKPRLLTGA